MLLLNKSPRLISINPTTKESDRINLMPAGQAVDVPEELCESKYVKALLQSGSIIEITESKKSDDPLDSMTIKDLKAYADGLEIEYDSKIKKDDLKELINSNA
jgi:hypothetical protein